MSVESENEVVSELDDLASELEESINDSGTSTDAEASAEPASESSDSPQVSEPEFQSFENSGSGDSDQDIDRLKKIQISVTAELGKTNISMQKLMSLTVGSVLELDQEIDSLVELVAQGVPLATGEVVVVEGHYGIRIVEVYQNN
ncbi:MAG: FliM/FliN family flagellar motor switch protein [Planctomycetota bacterium]